MIPSFNCSSSLETRDVEAGGGGGPFSVEPEAQKSYRFRFHIGYFDLMSNLAKKFCPFPNVDLSGEAAL